MRLTKTVSFKIGSYVSMHLTYMGNLVGHIMSYNGATVEVLGILKVDKTSMIDDGVKVFCIDDIIYCCRNIYTADIIDVAGEELQKASPDKIEEALAVLISRGEISFYKVPFFAENVFKAFKHRR
jgi:translation initiation factor 6 (eIF-6)